MIFTLLVWLPLYRWENWGTRWNKKLAQSYTKKQEWNIAYDLHMNYGIMEVWSVRVWIKSSNDLPKVTQLVSKRAAINPRPRESQWIPRGSQWIPHGSHVILVRMPEYNPAQADGKWAPEWTSQWSILAAGSCFFPCSSQGMISSRRQPVLPGGEGSVWDERENNPPNSPHFNWWVAPPDTAGCIPCQSCQSSTWKSSSGQNGLAAFGGRWSGLPVALDS